MNVADRLDELRRRISRAGRDPGEVTIVAVTKGVGVEVVRAALAAGLRDLGENYAQELLEKREQLGEDALDARWHFLGAIQRNKVSRLAPVVHLWQSVDRFAAGEAIARRAPGSRVLVQVNLSGEPQKVGCSWSDAPALVASLRDLDLDVQGLMGVATHGAPNVAAAQFRKLAELGRREGLPEVSMGMSEDFELAIEAGATIVRVGRALLGPRPGAPEVRR